MPMSMQAGDVLAKRYRLDDLLAETGTGRFWRAHDLVLHRPVSVHILAADDERADAVLEAARRSGPVINRRLLRVLDAEAADGRCYVVNEWGQGESLDNLLTREGPLPPRRAAWLVGEVADSVAEAHSAGLAHGSLTPENVLIDQHGQIRLIGFGVEAALRGLPPGRVNVDEIDLAGLLYCALTGKWAGVSQSAVPTAPEVHGEVLRPRRVRAGIPRMLDALCDQVLNPEHSPSASGADYTARHIADLLQDYVGDMTGTQVPVQAVRPSATPTPVPQRAAGVLRCDDGRPRRTGRQRARTDARAASPEPEPEPDAGRRSRTLPSPPRSLRTPRTPRPPSTTCPPRPGCRCSTTTTRSTGCAPGPRSRRHRRPWPTRSPSRSSHPTRPRVSPYAVRARAAGRPRATPTTGRGTAPRTRAGLEAGLRQRPVPRLGRATWT